MKTWTLAFCIFFISSASYATNPFLVSNNTNAFGTAQAGGSPCSSQAGDTGIIKPHADYTVSDDILNWFCKKSCTVKIYMNKNCSKPVAAEVKVDRVKGIQSLIDYHVNGFVFTGTEFKLTVDGGPKDVLNDA